ncbi:unnamed protein product [Darwinula stevensoni]|uniref:Uncharacterized protein n=1 Tax=Darwinula stevensoni TaxID=69355 RepID=A0A7R8X9M1_9CRUS|nr:unnamed protein product [Darwinula stevensoni]CAG0889113.1 unnamed protein product [Darwinula stevensoni]
MKVAGNSLYLVCLFASGIVSGEMQRSERRERESLPLLKVLSLLDPPYLMISGEDFFTNTKYEGVLVDLLDQLGDLVGFQYKIELVKDGTYGYYNHATQTWTGLVGGVIAGKVAMQTWSLATLLIEDDESMDQEGDMAAASLTISSARMEVVEFTKPWMYSGISVLYKHLPVDSGSGWMFLRPFTLSTWIAVAIMYVAVSLAYWAVARCSPEERRRSTVSGEPVFGIFNTFWVAFTPLLLRGNQEMPQALSTRLLTGIWWCFSLLILVLYSTMVAKEFTTAHYRPKVTSWKDLADGVVNFGAIKRSSTVKYFQDSRIPEYQKISDFLASHPEFLTSGSTDGTRRVLENPGTYAFLTETTTAEYLAATLCQDLVVVGPEFQRRAFGFALKKGSTWTDKMSKGILQLQEQGALHAIYRKYWKDRSKCPDTTKQFDQPQLDLPHLGGIFVALGISIFLSLLVAFLEVLLYVRKRDPTQWPDEELQGVHFNTSNEGASVILCLCIRLSINLIYELNYHRYLINLTKTIIGPDGNIPCSSRSILRGPHQKVISYSLYGPMGKPRAEASYEKLIFEIPDSAKTWYPGWVVRIYTNYSREDENATSWMRTIEDKFPSVDFCHVASLPGLSGDIQRVQSNGRVWRFLPMMDPLVDIFVSRDSDSPLSEREAAAVKEWLESKYIFHAMRDHPHHWQPAFAGGHHSNKYTEEDIHLLPNPPGRWTFCKAHPPSAIDQNNRTFETSST